MAANHKQDKKNPTKSYTVKIMGISANRFHFGHLVTL